MRTLKLMILLLTAIALAACGGRSENYKATVNGFSEIEKEIKKEFGDNAYFTDITITYTKALTSVDLMVTRLPESLKMEEWNLSHGMWSKTSDINVGVPPGSMAADFMFQLGDKINLTKFVELIEQAKESLPTKEELENPELTMASILYPDNGDASLARYVICLEPEKSSTSFYFYYTIDGELTTMDF